MFTAIDSRTAYRIPRLMKDGSHALLNSLAYSQQFTRALKKKIAAAVRCASESVVRFILTIP